MYRRRRGVQRPDYSIIGQKLGSALRGTAGALSAAGASADNITTDTGATIGEVSGPPDASGLYPTSVPTTGGYSNTVAVPTELISSPQYKVKSGFLDFMSGGKGSAQAQEYNFRAQQAAQAFARQKYLQDAAAAQARAMQEQIYKQSFAPEKLSALRANELAARTELEELGLQFKAKEAEQAFETGIRQEGEVIAPTIHGPNISPTEIRSAVLSQRAQGQQRKASSESTDIAYKQAEIERLNKLANERRFTPVYTDTERGTTLLATPEGDFYEYSPPEVDITTGKQIGMSKFNRFAMTPEGIPAQVVPRKNEIPPPGEVYGPPVVNAPVKANQEPSNAAIWKRLIKKAYTYPNPDAYSAPYYGF